MGLEILDLSNGNADDFPVDNLLSDYKDAATIVEPESTIKEEQTTVPEPPPYTDSEGRVPESVWRANPEKYFQRGSKKGLPRDKPFAKTSATYNTAATSSIPATMLINGALFLSVVNFVIPMIIITANNWLYPKEKMVLKDLKFTDSEKKEIDPLMDATLKQLNINGNPLVLLLIILTAGYAMKFIGKKVEFGVSSETDKEDKK